MSEPVNANKPSAVTVLSTVNYKCSKQDFLTMHGLVKDRGPMSIYLDKIRAVEEPPETAPAPTLPERMHKALQGLGAEIYSERTGRMLTPAFLPFTRPTHPIMAHHEMAAIDPEKMFEQRPETILLETKPHFVHAGKEGRRIVTVEVVPEDEAWFWGPEWSAPIHPRRKSDDPVAPVPLKAILAATFDMMVTNLHGACDVVAMFGHDVRIYTIGWDNVFGQVIENGIQQFWGNLIMPGKPPAAENARAVDLAQLYTDAKIGSGMKPANAEARSALVQLRMFRSATIEAKKQEDQMTAALCAMIGEYEGIDGVCTWKKEELPDGTSKRVLRLLAEESVPTASLH